MTIKVVAVLLKIVFHPLYTCPANTFLSWWMMLREFETWGVGLWGEGGAWACNAMVLSFRHPHAQLEARTVVRRNLTSSTLRWGAPWYLLLFSAWCTYHTYSLPWHLLRPWQCCWGWQCCCHPRTPSLTTWSSCRWTWPGTWAWLGQAQSAKIR